MIMQLTVIIGDNSALNITSDAVWFMASTKLSILEKESFLNAESQKGK